jgi:hypothetical protein
MNLSMNPREYYKAYLNNYFTGTEVEQLAKSIEGGKVTLKVGPNKYKTYEFKFSKRLQFFVTDKKLDCQIHPMFKDGECKWIWKLEAK